MPTAISGRAVYYRPAAERNTCRAFRCDSTGRATVIKEHSTPASTNRMTPNLKQQRQANSAVKRASDDHFRCLFERMDEGYCVIEVIFDESHKPVDYLFLECNPAFEKHTGIIAAV